MAKTAAKPRRPEPICWTWPLVHVMAAMNTLGPVGRMHLRRVAITGIPIRLERPKTLFVPRGTRRG